MADLQFHEEQVYTPRSNPAQQSFLTRFVLGSGIVDTEQGVQYVLLGATVFFVVATLWVGFASFGEGPTPTGSVEVNLKMLKEMNSQPSYY